MPKPMINSPSLNPNRYNPVKDLEKTIKKISKTKATISKYFELFIFIEY